VRRSRFSRELGWVRVEGFEMLSVRLLGECCFVMGRGNGILGELVLRGVAGGIV
jgi:hypothetical protein